MTTKRRFFSGPSLPAALVAAASTFGLDPEEVDYRVVEKKHGFLKVRHKVVIEVNADHPQKDTEKPPERKPPEQEPPRKVVQQEAAESTPASQPAATERPPLRPRRRPERATPSHPKAEGGRPAAQEGRPAPSTGEAHPPRRKPPSRPAEPRGELRDRPRLLPIEERQRRARGPLADSIIESIEWLLDLVDLDVDALVFEGEDRFDIELRGTDRDTLIAENGKILAALEHLAPRVLRGVAGEAHPCRVDSENFQELREERLRASAQRVAAQVCRQGRPEILEPMDPSDRRIIHVELADDPTVTTRSLGDGYYKRVKILPI